MSTNPLWDRIQQYMDDPAHRYPPQPADLARETGVSEQVLSKWKAAPVLPKVQQLIMFSANTTVPYVELLTAALQGKGYLPSEAEIVVPEGFQEHLDATYDERFVAKVMEIAERDEHLLRRITGFRTKRRYRPPTQDEVGAEVARIAARRGRKTRNTALEAQERAGEENQDG